MEIERKFLVLDDAYRAEAYRTYRIAQGYLCSAPERTVRVRLRDDEGFLTVKGPSDETGVSRYEFEQPVARADAEEMLRLCEPGIIDKERHLVRFGQHLWEVDRFHGDNEGLTVAEIELDRKDEPFERPAWLGREVTGEKRFYNAMLSKRPFNQWNADEIK
jgi:adenylate cyclase